MRILSIPLTLAALLLAILLGGPIAERWRDRNEYQATIERIEAADRAYQVEQTAATRAAGSNALQILLVLGIAGALWVLLDSYKARRKPLARFGGELVARDLIADADPALLALLADKVRAAGIAQIAAAQLPGPIAHSFNYSPRISAPAQLGGPIGLEQLQLAPPALASVPSFAQLLEGGRVGPDANGRAQPLILGYGESGAIEGTWRDLYSSAAGGLQGSGKTWGTAFLLAQSAAAGAQLVICDPQAGDVESLANRVAPLRSAMLCDIADDDKSIGAALDLAYDVLDRRDKGDSDRRPVIVAIDEWLSLRRGKLADRLPELVEAFSTRGRKMNVHCMLLTQRADKDAIGDFRNTLASSYIYRMRPDEARMLTGLRAAQLPPDVLQLEPGECYLLDTRGQLRKVRIPHCAPADLERVGQLLSGRPATTVATNVATGPRPFGFRPNPDRKPDGSLMVATGEQATSASVSPEAARAAQLFMSGLDPAEIVLELRGVRSSEGRRYQVALAEVLELIRQGIGAGAAPKA